MPQPPASVGQPVHPVDRPAMRLYAGARGIHARNREGPFSTLVGIHRLAYGSDIPAANFQATTVARVRDETECGPPWPTW